MRKYPSDPHVNISRFKSIDMGGSCNLLKLEFGSHVGTHVDAPFHIINNGNTVDNIPIKEFIRNAVVTDINSIYKKGFFKKVKSKRADAIIFKCEKNRNGLNSEDACMLVQNSIKLVGIDRMSIEEAPDRMHQIHKLLLSKGSIIVESLNLKNIRHGFCKIICLPLKIKNGDGAPARAALIYD
jgi:arylformamidase